MEDKMAWKRVHAELVEDHRLAQDASSTLTKARACQNELFSRFTADVSSGPEEREKTEPGDKSESTPSWTIMSALHSIHNIYIGLFPCMFFSI